MAGQKAVPDVAEGVPGAQIVQRSGAGQIGRAGELAARTHLAVGQPIDVLPRVQTDPGAAGFRPVETRAPRASNCPQVTRWV